MKIIHTELTSALIMSSIVTILVLMFTPHSAANDENYKNRPVMIGIKSFILSFAITFAIFCMVSDPPIDNVMKNIIQSEPDF